MKQYLDLMSAIMTFGTKRLDRTGTGTIGLFGAQMRFDLKNNQFPLVTTKKVFTRGIIEELLWFLRGSTNNEELAALNVHIWDGWALKEDVVDERRLEGYELAAKYADVMKITLTDARGRLQRATNLDGMDAGIKMITDAGIELTEKTVKALKGELGPIYGKQWRAWEAPGGRRIDQIAEVIEILKTKPHSRRMVVTAWNPADLPDESISPQENVINGRQSLASCHCLFQFDTRPLTAQERTQAFEKAGGSFPALTALYAEFETGLHTADTGVEVNERLAALDIKVHEIHDLIGTAKYGLSCQLYQRSCDYFLGVPFNIASYALLTAMIAQVVNMVPDEFIWTGGNVHIYSNHFAQVEEQLSREELPGPTLWLNPAIKNIDDFRLEDIEIRDYQSHATIKAPVSV